MNLHDTMGADPNRLPFFVTDGAGNRVVVEFASLAEADRAELEGTDWLGAVYREVWIAYCKGPGTLKLVEVGGASPTLGLVRPGMVAEGDMFLRHSLLETLPPLRFHARSVSPLRGVGRVLVARLVVESYNQGANGAVFITARPEAVNFYRHLGFAPVANRPLAFRAFPARALQVFEEATL